MRSKAYYDHKSDKIGFTNEFTVKSKTGNRLKKELEKKWAYFNYEELEREDRTTFYLLKVSSVDIFISPNLQEEFKAKVQKAFHNYIDIKDKRYSEMESRNEFF